jgi:hypothetical protein
MDVEFEIKLYKLLINFYPEEITRKFSMARDESSTLWISREKAASTSRKLYKSPEFVYEECSGCGHVFKPSSK